MSKGKNYIIKKLQVITYIVVGALIAGVFVIDANNYIDLKPGFVFIMFGFILLPMGIFGLINNEVSLGNAKSLTYERNSIAGKMDNVTIIITGVITLAIGIFALIN